MLRKTDYRLSTILNKRVEIWHNTTSKNQNKLGQYPIQPELFATVYACVIPTTGSLLQGRQASTALSKTTHKIIVRYRGDLLPDMWIEYKGQRFNILYIMDTNFDHERLEIFCEVLT